MRLRALIPALLLAALPLGVHAQEGLFIRAGLNMAYAPLDSLNGVLQRHDDRAQPDQPLGQIHLISGATLHAGFAAPHWLWEVAYTGRRGRATAETGDPAVAGLYRTQVRVGIATADFGLAYRVTPAFALGLSLDLGAVTSAIRRGYPGQLGYNVYYRINQGITLGSSLFAQVDIPVHDRVRIGLRPYAHYNFIRADFSSLNSALNPTTFQSDPLFILGNTANVGLKLTAMVGLW